MFGDADERSPLLQFPGAYEPARIEELGDAYKQFTHLVGNRPADHPPGESYHPPHATLYHRAVEHRNWQGRMYAFSSFLTNSLLLSQIVLGAALTGLAATKDSSRVLITVLGAMNTVIAGLIAFLKSRGQPMRARMFRDDLDRVVDEIENSATMWKGISSKAHGYDAIDTDDSVTVRSEVARLTRLYDRAVRTNTMNDPDNYGAGPYTDSGSSGLRSRTGQPLLAAMPANMPAVQAGSSSAPLPGIPGPAADPDESPATKVPAPKKDEEPPKEESKPSEAPNTSDGKGKEPEDPKVADSTTSTTPAVPAPSAADEAPTPAPVDPDESPATRPNIKTTRSESKSGAQSSTGDQAKPGASS